MSQKIWSTAIDVDTLNQYMKKTLAEHLNIQFTEVHNNYLVAKMIVSENHLQPEGIMHGGASCVLAETIGSVAANCCVDREKKTCVGLDINVNHLRAVQKGSLKAVTKPYHIGRTTHVWNIEIFNEAGKLTAISRLTIAVIDRFKIG